MDPEAMAPFGKALKAYQDGNANTEVIVRRDDGVEGHLPINHFFRGAGAFSRIECEALDRCRGHVLDVGAGAGAHSLELQRRGMLVTAIDICPEAVHVMKQRGVTEGLWSDIFAFRNGKFETILLMGHGIGMMETLSGLDRFLVHALTLLSAGGTVLLDSMDPAASSDPQNLAYHAMNRSTGRYIGEVKMRFEFQGKVGPYCGWLHVDPLVLSSHASSAGWSSSIILHEASGDYLAQLEKRDP